ncbi:MAG: stage V sporulation protein D [Ruminococcaceae bacterium]|nr:stage V sporulation protein D [Oscillospiraceae bacterium]
MGVPCKTMNQTVPKRKFRIRILSAFIAFAVLLSLLGVRLVFLQLIQGSDLKQKAIEQQTRDSLVASHRGAILDRNYKTLAQSSTAHTVTANPNEIQKSKKDIGEIAVKLASVLEMDTEEIVTLLNKKTNHVTIKRRIEDDVVTAVRELDLTGVYLQEDAKRYYPYGNFASHILGFVGNDNQGLGGIEAEYEEELKGAPGRVIALKNALETDMPFKEEKHIDPENGINVVLTIDEVVQHFAEKHLEQAYYDEKVQAGACAIVSDVKTGEILAMATKPDFDLNDPFTLPEDVSADIQSIANDDERREANSNALQKMWRNKAVVDSYEPGSCFKIITGCMALEEGLITPDSTFFCSGSKKVENYNIGCSHRDGHGSQTFADAVKNSCNPAFIEVGQLVGKEKFKEYYKAFGFLDTTGFDLPGEASGIFYADESYNEVELATASFGQGPKVTPLQLMAAVGAVANGGKLMKPYLVKELVDNSGNVVKKTDPTVVRQVISQKTSEQMCAMLENTVANGTGQNAYIKGYRVAGKTGTSEKVPRGSQKYIASFIAFAPANDPKVACLVVLDEPSNGQYYGGAIAAPVVGKILEDTLRYMDVEPQYTEEEKQNLDVSVPNVKGLSRSNAIKNLTNEQLNYRIVGNGETIKEQMPKAGSTISGGSIVILYTEDSTSNYVTVPDVTNLSVGEVQSILAEHRLNLSIAGAAATGNAGNMTVSDSQSPDPGTEVEEGTIIEVQFRYLDVD